MPDGVQTLRKRGKAVFRKVLIANRGEIAIRVIRACKELGIETVAIFTEHDANALYVQKADQAFLVKPGPIRGYLDYEQIVELAKEVGAEAIHPGYGFLAENPAFARYCEENGVIFIGPKSWSIGILGDKVLARKFMMTAGVPVLPGSEPLEDVEDACSFAEEIGYPVMLKPKDGGGGKGMRLANNEEELRKGFPLAQSVAEGAFGTGTLLLERFVPKPRHIEIQILADKWGYIVHLGERDCSIQRRHQKLIEIAPSLVLDDEKRQEMGKVAIRAAKAVDYHSAGAVEFLMDEKGNYYFLEMNTRIQVEHTVTELVTGVDIVKEQIWIAAGYPLSISQEDIKLSGCAIECRINAEDPMNNFFPSPGKVTGYQPPGGIGVRLDSSIFGGYRVSPYFDSMISKLSVWGRTWAEAVDRMARALDEYVIRGIKTTIPLHRKIINDEDFRNGNFTTYFMEQKIDQLTYGDVKDPMDRFFVASAAVFMDLMTRSEQR